MLSLVYHINTIIYDNSRHALNCLEGKRRSIKEIASYLSREHSTESVINRQSFKHLWSFANNLRLNC